MRNFLWPHIRKSVNMVDFFGKCRKKPRMVRGQGARIADQAGRSGSVALSASSVSRHSG